MLGSSPFKNNISYTEGFLFFGRINIQFWSPSYDLSKGKAVYNGG